MLGSSKPSYLTELEGDEAFIKPLQSWESRCPKCNESYHQKDFGFFPDNNEYQGEKHGYRGRGEFMWVDFKCEGGHKIRLIFGNHKGRSFIGLVPATKIEKKV